MKLTAGYAFRNNVPKDKEMSANLVFHNWHGPGDSCGFITSSMRSLSDITDFYRSIFLRL